MRHKIVLACLLAVLQSCISGLSPRDVAEHYLDSLAKLDFTSAAQDTAGDGKTNLEQIQQVFSALSADEQEKFRVKDWKVTGHTQMEDTATVDFLFDKIKAGKLTLKNYAGSWKIVSRQTF